MQMKTETVAWILFAVLFFGAVVTMTISLINAPKASCNCTECVYSMGGKLNIVVPIGDKQVKVSGTIPTTFTCDKVGGE